MPEVFIGYSNMRFKILLYINNLKIFHSMANGHILNTLYDTRTLIVESLVDISHK